MNCVQLNHKMFSPNRIKLKHAFSNFNINFSYIDILAFNNAILINALIDLIINTGLSKKILNI